MLFVSLTMIDVTFKVFGPDNKTQLDSVCYQTHLLKQSNPGLALRVIRQFDSDLNFLWSLLFLATHAVQTETRDKPSATHKCPSFFSLLSEKKK